MTTVVGQTRLLNKLNNYSSTNMPPKTMMFIGPSGCGKHVVARYLAEKLELEYVEINDTLTYSDIVSYMSSTINTLYVIDLNTLLEKQQNQLLKFIEEPTASAYMLLLATSEAAVLNTVLNRCIKHRFDAYSQEEIESILGTAVDPLAFAVFKTPGKLLNLTSVGFNSTMALARDVVYNTRYKTYADTLLLATKLNYKDLYDKIDFNLFFDAVEYLALEDFKQTQSMQSLKVFNVTSSFNSIALNTRLIKETLVINYLTTLWEALNNDIS